MDSSPSSGSSRFAVLELGRDERDPMALARALAAARGTPVQDQVITARRAWGIVEEDLTEAEATALAKTLTASGVECIARPASSLARLPDAESVTALEALPADRPALVAVAGLTIMSTRTTTEKKGPTAAQKVASTAIMLGTGLPIKVGGRKRTVEKTERREALAFYSDLHYEASSRRLRIDAARFDFSCLGERMLYQGQGNLKLLIGDIVQGTPDAWRNHGARVLLEGRPIRTMGYGSLADLEREARWLLTLRALGL